MTRSDVGVGEIAMHAQTCERKGVTVRYIGSKARVVASLSPHVGPPPDSAARFVDAFCGTGAVAEEAARLGWAIHLNDSLTCAVTMAQARLLSRNTARFAGLGGYETALDALNATRPKRGFIWREYSPASQAHAGVVRMYFSEANAKKIDGMRAQIARWRQERDIGAAEEALLVADLLLAANRVANIAGTYGCFLSHWSAQSQERLRVRPRELFPRHVDVTATVGDVAVLATRTQDLAYLDPPYTKRQYAAYYHILETIALGDQPVVSGVTGLRPWQDKASPFCYRTRALRALIDIVGRLEAKKVLLSYSSEGHVELEALADGLTAFGQVSVSPLQRIGRYRPNRAAGRATTTVTEFLIAVERRAAHRAARWRKAAGQ